MSLPAFLRDLRDVFRPRRVLCASCGHYIRLREAQLESVNRGIATFRCSDTEICAAVTKLHRAAAILEGR